MEEYLVLVKDWLMEYGMTVLGAIVILIVGRIAISIVVSIFDGIMKRRETDETLRKFFTALIKTALMAFLVVILLDQLGIHSGSFVAIIGAAGLAIGFALQGSLSNFAAGVMLIIFRPFKAGDFVEAGGAAGVIEAIGIFVTTMKSPDNKSIIIPNSQITGGNIVNFSAKDTRRVDMVFGIGYDDDIKKAKSILERLMAEDERILKDPAPVVAVSELADSSVNFVARPWVKTADYWAVFFDLHEKVKLTFDAEGISIPYPQQDVHMHQVPAA